METKNTQQVETVKSKPEYIVTGKDLIEMDIKEIPMLVEPILQKIGIAVLGGSSDTGKSTLLRQLSRNIVLGESHFLGFKLNPKYNSVIYVCTEDDETAISYYIKKGKFDPDSVAKMENLRYIFDSSSLLVKLESELERQRADLIIVDAFADIFEGDMNMVNKIRSYMDNFSNIAKRYGCLVLFLHHTGKKAEEKVPSKNNLLGSQGFEGKARVVIELRRDPVDNHKRHICIVKGNYVTDDLKDRSFVLTQDDNLVFEMTEERVEFELLVPRNNQGKAYINNPQITERVMELTREGKSRRKIANKMTEDGYKIGKSQVNNIIRENS